MHRNYKNNFDLVHQYATNKKRSFRKTLNFWPNGPKSSPNDTLKNVFISLPSKREELKKQDLI